MKQYKGETIKGWARVGEKGEYVTPNRFAMVMRVILHAWGEGWNNVRLELALNQNDFARWDKAIPVTIRITPRKEKKSGGKHGKTA